MIVKTSAGWVSRYSGNCLKKALQGRATLFWIWVLILGRLESWHHTRGCRVVAFEPDRDSMRLCRTNALLNGLEGRFEFVEAAVGGSDCTVRLYEALEN